MESNIEILKDALKDRNAFIDRKWLNKLLTNSNTEIVVKKRKIHKAELNPIDPSIQKITRIGSYLYVYKRASEQFR